MIEKTPTDKIVINIDGEKGNAFFLLGQARTFAKDLSLDYNKILDEMNTLVKKDGFSNISEAVGSKNFQFLMDETDRSIFG